MSKREDRNELQLWTERLERSTAAYQGEQKKIDRRERQYSGDREISPVTENDYKRDGKKRTTAHVWNVTAENIEAMIDSTIPMPKVTSVRKEDERLARIIENMLRNEINRLPTELINDEGERTAKKQGGVGVLVEWDATKRSHSTVGENGLQLVHPKRIVPQEGVKNLRDMDYYFLLMPMSKSEVKRRWGKSVERLSEENPEVREEGASGANDLVTVKYAVYKNEDGGVGTFIWVNNVVLASYKDVQARQIRRCKKCGATEVENAIMLEQPSINGEFPEGSPERKPRRDECAYCGARSWEVSKDENRRVTIEELKQLGAKKDVIEKLAAQVEPVVLPMGEVATAGGAAGFGKGNPSPTGMIGGAPGEIATAAGGLAMTEMGMSAMGGQGRPPLQMGKPEERPEDEQGITVPYYTPNLYPLVMWQNVTAFASFLGESDCDKVMDQQNTLNRMSQKILDRLVKAGTKILLPSDAQLYTDSEDNDVIRVTKLTDAALAQVKDFSGNLQYEFNMISQVYSESQRILGITESFLGRSDPTAQSGKAKQFAAAQTAGRMESKRVLKKAAWADIYERMFKNMLAYADERRPVHFVNEEGNVDYEQFNAWEFLEIDEAGELYWNDQFLFSCDDASGLAANREAMWQETTAHMQSGAFGNPGEINTLIIYWTAMERLHYPGANDIKKLLQEQQQQQMQQQAVLMQMQQQQQMAAAGQEMPQAAQPGAGNMGGMM